MVLAGSSYASGPNIRNIRFTVVVRIATVMIMSRPTYTTYSIQNIDNNSVIVWSYIANSVATRE